MARHLTERIGFEYTPRYLGHAEFVPDDGDPMVLAGAFRFIANQGDAWHVVTEALAKTLEEYGLDPAESELPELAFPVDIGRKLGRRTADLHVALAAPTSDRAFAPEPIGQDDIRRWIAETRFEAARAFEALHGLDDKALSAGVRQGVEALRARAGRVERALDTLSVLEPSGMKTRIHGDYHLGQILIVQNDMMIVDFEGEPSRPLAERRAKTSPLVDLAGALRSLDYAAWTALDRVTAAGIVTTEHVGPLASRWRDRQVADCVAAYRAIARPAGAYPTDDQTADRLLTLFLLRKAFYELGYEIGSRPAWVSIPIRGIIDLLDRIGGRP